MNINRVFLATILTMLQAGCSEFYGYQPPAPVYGRSATNPYEVEPFRTYPDDRAARPDAVYSTKPPGADPQFNAPDSGESAVSRARTQSPAVMALMTESERNRRAGDMDSAVAALERALRIDPRNPTLTYKLAELRIKQEKPRLAEDLAKKAALLAAGDAAIKRKSWLLISEARRMQQNYQGAKEAELKARSFVTP